MKSTLIALLFFIAPSAAIADNLPVNYIIWRGRVYSLDALWGKGVQTTQIAQPTVQTVPMQTQTNAVDSREVVANRQRVEFENARNRLIIEQLQR